MTVSNITKNDFSTNKQIKHQFVTKILNIIKNIENEYPLFPGEKLWFIKAIKDRVIVDIRTSKTIADVLWDLDIYSTLDNNTTRINYTRHFIKTADDFIHLGNGGSLEQLMIVKKLKLI